MFSTKCVYKSNDNIYNMYMYKEDMPFKPDQTKHKISTGSIDNFEFKRIEPLSKQTFY